MIDEPPDGAGARRELLGAVDDDENRPAVRVIEQFADDRLDARRLADHRGAPGTGRVGEPAPPGPLPTPPGRRGDQDAQVGGPDGDRQLGDDRPCRGAARRPGAGDRQGARTGEGIRHTDVADDDRERIRVDGEENLQVAAPEEHLDRVRGQVAVMPDPGELDGLRSAAPRQHRPAAALLGVGRRHERVAERRLGLRRGAPGLLPAPGIAPELEPTGDQRAGCDDTGEQEHHRLAEDDRGDDPGEQRRRRRDQPDRARSGVGRGVGGWTVDDRWACHRRGRRAHERNLPPGEGCVGARRRGLAGRAQLQRRAADHQPVSGGEPHPAAGQRAADTEVGGPHRPGSGDLQRGVVGGDPRVAEAAPGSGGGAEHVPPGREEDLPPRVGTPGDEHTDRRLWIGPCAEGDRRAVTEAGTQHGRRGRHVVPVDPPGRAWRDSRGAADVVEAVAGGQPAHDQRRAPPVVEDEAQDEVVEMALHAGQVCRRWRPRHAGTPR